MPTMSPPIIVIYCGLLLTVGAFSIDITLPAFSLIARDLATEYANVQLVIPVFLMASGIGQLFMGPYSDRFGRRLVVLTAMAIYFAGSVICFIAPGIEWLLAGRAIQGFGASAGPVLGRAILRDLFTGRQLASNLAIAVTIFAVGPIVAPLLGVSIMSLGTWRLIFLVISGFGLFLLAAGYLSLPETIRATDPAATRPGTLWRNTGTVFANSQSRFYVLMSAPIMAIMISILVTIPRVYEQQFGVTGTLFAILFALHGIGIIIGQTANRWIIAGYGVPSALLAGAVVLVLVGLAIGGLVWSGMIGPYILSFTLILFATGFLTVASNATALALDPHGEIAGFVSSFLGFIGQFGSSLIGLIVARLVGGELDRFAIAIIALAGFTLIMLLMREKLNPSV